MIHLDTSFLIRALVPGSKQEQRLLAWLDGPEPVALSAIAWAEFLCGPVSAELTDLARTLLGEPVPLGAAEAETAATLFNGAGRRRSSLLDCLVDATALQAGATLATENLRDFERFKTAGLTLVTVNHGPYGRGRPNALASRFTASSSSSSSRAGGPSTRPRQMSATRL